MEMSATLLLVMRLNSKVVVAQSPVLFEAEALDQIPTRLRSHGVFMLKKTLFGYGSIPINTIFSGMNIHLPAILMFTRGTRVLTHCHFTMSSPESPDLENMSKDLVTSGDRGAVDCHEKSPRRGSH